MKPRPRIMIVEDERASLLVLKRQLPNLGYDICGCAATGEDAVKKASELRPDLLLMDICLTGAMDGIQSAESIRSRIDVPVIYLSSTSDEATLKRAKLSRPSSFLIKPFKGRELQVAIDMALLNHGLNRDLREAQDQLEQRVAKRTDELARAIKTLHIEVDVRKRMEARAREQADLLAKARDAIYVRDLKGSISFWNRGAERLYGIPADDAMGQKAQVILGEEQGATTGPAEQSTLKDGEWMGELKQLTRSGQELVVESRWTLVRDEFGAPKRVLVVNTDITERKRIAEQLMRTQRLESIGALASGIAHDLNNVFAPILMAAELMEETGRPNARILEMLKSTTQRGADMVRQVLMFVRGGASEMEPTNLCLLATEVRRLMRETLPCSIRVHSKIPKNLRPVLADPTQLHQLLMNLCINARDAMPDGGQLSIEVEEVVVDEAKAREIDGAKAGPCVRLAVADTGTGIAPELRAKIFEPFFTTKDVGKGTGLGLSTVASIVQAHRGILELETEVGCGSRFLI